MFGGDKVIAGVSLTQDPLTKNKLVGSSLTQLEANKPNTLDSNGVKYFSINDIYDYNNINTHKRDSNGRVYPSGNCPDYFIYRGSVKQCVSSCLESFVTLGNGEKECTGVCASDEYVLDANPVSCLSVPCPSTNPPSFYKGSIDATICLPSCTGDYSYKDGVVCQDRCYDYILDEGAISSSNTCSDTCSGYELRHPDLKYADNADKVYCRNTCDYGTYTKFYTDNGVKKCVPACGKRGVSGAAPDSLPYELNNECVDHCPSDNKLITNVGNFGTNNEYGICASSCGSDPNQIYYQLIHPSLKYTNIAGTPQKYYCVASCSYSGYTKFYADENNNNIKICIDICGRQSTVSLVLEPLRYLNGSECLAECPANTFISASESVFNTINEYGDCQSACGDPNFQLTHSSLKYSSNNPKAYCKTSCNYSTFTNFYRNGSNKVCTDICGRQSGNSSSVLEPLRYLNGTECLLECPTNTFISALESVFNTINEYGDCISDCEDPNFQLTHSALKYTSNNPKAYCKTSCNYSTFTNFYRNGSNSICTDICGRQSGNSSSVLEPLRYLNGAECLLECPSNNFISALESIFNTAAEYGDCLSVCEDPNFQLTHSTLKYASNNPKAYCKATCNYSTFTNFYRNSNDNICTDICGRQSTASSVLKPLRYLNNTECLLECPSNNFILAPESVFNTVNEYGDCQSACGDPNFQLTHSALKYASNNPKAYCKTTCNYSTFTNFYKNGSNKVCTDKCGQQSSTSGVPDTLPYLNITECLAECPANTFISTVVNFNTSNEYGMCINTCDSPNFQLEDTDFKYTPSNNQKYYCSNTCATFSYNYFYESGSFKKCTDKCGRQSSTSGVPDTLSYLNNTECLTECPSNTFISTVVNFNTNNEYGVCVSTCDSPNFQLEDTDFKYTPSNNQKYYCSNTCSIFSYNYFYESGSFKKCTDKCGRQSSTSGVPDTLPYLNNTECLAECPTDNQFILNPPNFNTSNEYGTCASTCNTPQFQLESSDFKYNPSNRIKTYCLDTCDKETYINYYTDTSTQHCVNDCRHEQATNTMVQDRRYRNKEGLIYKCQSSCSSTYITEVREPFNTSDSNGLCHLQQTQPCLPEEDGLCTSGCSSSQNILQDASIKFPDGSLKIYCLSDCTKYPFDKEYTDNGITTCTNSCLVENAIVPTIPNIRYHYYQGNKTICVSKCPSTHPFINNPSFFNTSLENAECVSSCDKYVTASNSLLYLDETPKQYCTDTCLLGDLNFFFISDSTNNCINSCLSPLTGNNRYLLVNNLGLKQCVNKCPVMIANTENFNASDESGKCETDCGSGFTLTSSSYLWSDGGEKTYCVDSCTQFVETHPYSTPDRNCVSSCQLAGFTYTMKDKSCSNQCSLFILHNVFCVSECPSEYPLVEDQHCVKKCSTNNPFIREFKFCTTTCSDLRYEDMCVDSCENTALAQYLLNQGRIFVPKPFISSKRTCEEECSEQTFSIINFETNECISTCPPKCEADDCLYDHLVYTDEQSYCRETCEESLSPLTDNTLMKCLSRCETERPFIFEKECLDICPPSHSLVTQRPLCENAVCGSECSLVNQLCSEKCPEDFPLQLARDGVKYCVCRCPPFYIIDGVNCKLFCDPVLGFIPNLTQTSCNHCFNDLNQSFFNDGSCVDSCPPGTAPNKHHVCTPCFDLNLWTNEENRCIPFSKCNRLSYFDESKKLCTLCEGEELMIVKRRTEYTCEKTTCEGGYISQTLSKPICVFCQPSEFFEDPNCKATCPAKLKYDFYNKSCLDCPNDCSCCTNGKCRGLSCECESGWTGRYCNVPTEYSTDVIQSIISFMNNRLSSPSLESNENYLISEVAILYKISQRRLDMNPLTLDTFIKNVFQLVKKQHVKYAYQPSLLNTIDNLIQLAISYFEKTKNRDRLDQIVEFLYEITNDIQIFNVAMTATPEFEIVTQAKFEGSGFNLSFGMDVTEEERFDLSTCLDKIKLNLGFPTEHKFPYRLITLKPSFETVRREENIFIASTSPFVMMLSLYTRNGLIDIEKQCKERFIDLSYEIEVEEEVFQRINTLSTSKSNLFDKQDPFFNDRCIPFSDGQDLTLEKRKEKLFIDPSKVCSESPKHICTVDTTAEDKKIKCSCRGIQDKKKSTLESVFSSYPKSNYILVTCFSTFMDAVLKRNVGFYTIIVPCILVLLLIYHYNWRIDEELTDKRRFQYMRTDIQMYEPKSMDKNIYFEECFKLENELNLILLEITAIGSDKNIEDDFDFTSLPTLPDLALLSIEETLRLDKRSNSQFARDIFLYENTLYYAIFSKSTIDPKPFVLLLFVTELNLSVTLNCFFIDDDMVDNFNEIEENSLLNSFSREIATTIWALITSKFLKWLLYVFYSFKERQARLLKKRLVLTRDSSAVKAYNLFLTEHTWRLLLLLFSIVVFNLFCVYFVVIYNEIYTESSRIWLNGILMGLFVDIVLIQGVTPLLLVVTRALAKKYTNCEFLFRITSGLNNFKNISFFD